MSIGFEKVHPAKGTAYLSNQVRDNMRKRILEGEWAVGAKVPGEFELARQYDVARVTVRTAMHSLETQGLIDIRHGSGAYVANFGTTVRAGLQELRSITQTIREMGHKPGMQHRTSEYRPATASEAEDLFLEEGTGVLYLERSITADGEVVAFSYDTVNIVGIPKAICNKIAKGSLFKGLDLVDRHPVRARTEIHAIKSSKIGWGPNKPKEGLYLMLRQVHYLRDGTPVATGDTYFVEGSFQFMIHRTR